MNPPPGTPIPQALYSCSREDCASEVTHPPDMIYWVDDWNGWYCENCISYDMEPPEFGISLEKYMNKPDTLRGLPSEIIMADGTRITKKAPQ